MMKRATEQWKEPAYSTLNMLPPPFDAGLIASGKPLTVRHIAAWITFHDAKKWKLIPIDSAIYKRAARLCKQMGLPVLK